MRIKKIKKIIPKGPEEGTIVNIKLYQCINNGFDTSFGLVDNKYYGLSITQKYIDIYDGDQWVGAWEIQKWQDFDDYFISKADLRDKQIDSILND